jgi:signal transduction histidine kinase
MRIDGLIIIAWLAALASAAWGGEKRPQSVLVIDEYSQNYPRSVQINRGFITTLDAESGHSVYTHFENLSVNAFEIPHYYELFRDFLKEKYRGTKLGVIVSYGSLSLSYATRLRDELWPQTPLVFAGVNEFTADRLKRPAHSTGITVRHRLQDMVDVAKTLFPDFRTLVLVGDRLGSNNFWKHFVAELPNVKNQLPVVDLTGMSFDQLLRRVASLPKDAVIAYLGISRDNGEIRYVPRDALRIFAKSANRPIVVDDETFIGFGAIGGRVVDIAAIGRQAALRTWHIINGADAASMPFTSLGTSTPVFDWRELRRWKISESRLPAKSEIRFKPLTAWEQYHWQIVALTFILLTQSWLIAWLVREQRRRRRAELETRHRMAEIYRLNRAATAGALAASIAHEINQPLGAIVASGNAAIRWLNRKKPNIGEAATALKRIVDEGHHASEVIAATRAMIRMEKQQRAPIDVATLIREVRALAKHQLAHHRIKVIYRISAQLPPVAANRTQLQQVLSNLVNNAVEAMRSVSAHPRILQLGADMTDPSHVKITVADTGAGFDPELADHLFEPFYTTRSEGMGLGLSICRTIVESHGGTLYAAPRHPHGAVFTIVLPAIQPEADK